MPLVKRSGVSGSQSGSGPPSSWTIDLTVVKAPQSCAGAFLFLSLSSVFESAIKQTLCSFTRLILLVAFEADVTRFFLISLETVSFSFNSRRVPFVGYFNTSLCCRL